MLRFQLKRADLLKKSLSECWFLVLSHLFEILFSVSSSVHTPGDYSRPTVGNSESVARVRKVFVHLFLRVNVGL